MPRQSPAEAWGVQRRRRPRRAQMTTANEVTVDELPEPSATVAACSNNDVPVTAAAIHAPPPCVDSNASAALVAVNSSVRVEASAPPVRRSDASATLAINKASWAPSTGKAVPASPARPVVAPQPQSKQAAAAAKPPVPPTPPTHDAFYDNIGGADPPIRALRDLVESPLRHPHEFAALGVRPSRGMHSTLLRWSCGRLTH